MVVEWVWLQSGCGVGVVLEWVWLWSGSWGDYDMNNVSIRVSMEWYWKKE